MFPQSMFLVGRFFFSLNQPSLTNHVGDQPDLKWGYPFEQATLGITAAGSCALIWGCRRCICCGGPEATPPPGSCLGEKTLPSHSLSLDNRKELCFYCYFEREMWLLGYGRWRLDRVSGTCPRYLGASCDLLVTLRMRKGWVGRLHSEAPATWGRSHVSSVGQSYCFLASGLFPLLPYVNQDTNQTRSRGCLRS